MSIESEIQIRPDGISGAIERIEWTELEIELDEEKDCKFFPSRTADEVYRLVSVAVTLLSALRIAFRFLGVTGSPQVIAQMDSLQCDVLLFIAQQWNGGGTEECVEYELVPGHKQICVDNEEDAL